jgi:carbonic anhydrase
MTRNSRVKLYALTAGLCFFIFAQVAAAAPCQIAQPEDKAQPSQHHVPDTAGQKCDPHFTYTPGPHDPSHWEGACNTGHMQSPVDITHSEKLRLAPINFNYQPVDLKIFNDCNHYQVKVLFPHNLWLKIGKKPYSLTEFHFHEPGEHAVNGKRAAMAIHLVHLSPEWGYLVIEVPVIEGKENPVIKSLWEHIPESGKEQTVPGVKINVKDLLPADRDFYRLSGSLTTPICKEGVTWYVLKNSIEMSLEQIAEYKKHYHDTARPLQPANARPVAEPFVK